ncbi:uncharacterized protein [Onthophagus taurus]|uniref:uncharacterized protein n=1 Tax=Onthophagus taurus TaxID=166361 RepID=UPI0039BE6631
MVHSPDQETPAKEEKVIKDENIYTILEKAIAEVFGTATLLFVGCMGCIGAEVSFAPHFGALSFGLAVAVAVQMYGHISGGHYNLCVTIAAVILKKIDLVLAGIYFISQTVGALLGYGLLMLVTNENDNKGVCVTQINPYIKVYQGFIIEMIISGFLISICCAVWDHRNTKNTDSIPIRFGLTLGSIFIATAQYTGASMNPARSLAPAIFQNMWKDHWVYWVAPILGSAGTALFYRFIFIEGLAKAGRKFISTLIIMVGEILGTATYIFLGCMGCISNTYPNMSFQFHPFNFGLGIALAIQLFGHISGAHFNPIVSIAALIMQTVKITMFPFYVLAQFIGVFLGYGLIMALVPETSAEHLCVTVPSSGVTDVQALFIETIGSFLLVMALCSVWDPRMKGLHDSLALKIGLMLSAIFLAVAQFTGSGLNPARSLVPAIFHGVWDAHWIYWVGPILGGGLIAPILYRFVLMHGISIEGKDQQPKSSEKEPVI